MVKKECEEGNHKFRNLYYRRKINGKELWIQPKNLLICTKCEKIIDVTDNSQIKIERLKGGK